MDAGNELTEMEERDMLKKCLLAGLIALLIAACAVSACAAGLEDFNDYENEDGSYTYFFMQGLFVTMPAEWYENTMVVADVNNVTFRHRASYERYAAEGIEGGGMLFSIGCSVNTDIEDFEEMTYIGFDDVEMLNYFAIEPTDYPAYAADAGVRAEYDALYSGVDDVIAGIRLANAE